MLWVIDNAVFSQKHNIKIIINVRLFLLSLIDYTHENYGLNVLYLFKLY